MSKPLSKYAIQYRAFRFDEIAAFEHLDETDLFLHLYPGSLERINKCLAMHDELVEFLKKIDKVPFGLDAIFSEELSALLAKAEAE